MAQTALSSVSVTALPFAKSSARPPSRRSGRRQRSLSCKPHPSGLPFSSPDVVAPVTSDTSAADAFLPSPNPLFSAPSPSHDAPLPSPPRRKSASVAYHQSSSARTSLVAAPPAGSPSRRRPSARKLRPLPHPDQPRGAGRASLDSSLGVAPGAIGIGAHHTTGLLHDISSSSSTTSSSSSSGRVRLRHLSNASAASGTSEERALSLSPACAVPRPHVHLDPIAASLPRPQSWQQAALPVTRNPRRVEPLTDRSLGCGGGSTLQERTQSLPRLQSLHAMAAPPTTIGPSSHHSADTSVDAPVESKTGGRLGPMPMRPRRRDVEDVPAGCDDPRSPSPVAPSPAPAKMASAPTVVAPTVGGRPSSPSPLSCVEPDVNTHTFTDSLHHVSPKMLVAPTPSRV